MIKLTITILFTTLITSLFSQPLGQAYLIYFNDKANTPYSIENPSEFLTAAAIERRLKQGIIIQDDDIPVNTAYIEAVTASGAQVAAVSRWFNSVAVWINNTSIIPAIEAMPYVKEVKQMGSGSKSSKKTANWKSKPFFEHEINDLPVPLRVQKTFLNDYYNYGAAGNQIQMINGNYLHNQSFRGQEIVIAVLDAGFRNVDVITAFDSLRVHNRILGTRDFVRPGNNVFNPQIHTHGTNVLSIIAANLPGQMIGTAPEASYWLLRTEDADGPGNNTEYLMEEYFWIAGAEFADSVGAWVINSSLGYTVFDDSSQNHSYNDLDGNTTPVTMGANRAVSKGILVVNSAGNSGNSSWKYIIAPADGFQVLAVGAVKSSGIYATFSSTGPSADGRIKPDVSAQGDSTAYVNYNGLVRAGNGTSYSSPVIAGMAACLWQTNTGASNADVYQAIIRSGSQFMNPDNFLGYGIPDFELARFLLSADTLSEENKGVIRIFPNPAISQIVIETLQPGFLINQIRIYDLNGRCRFDKSFFPERQQVIETIDFLESGMYLLRVYSDGGTENLKMIRL